MPISNVWTGAGGNRPGIERVSGIWVLQQGDWAIGGRSISCSTRKAYVSHPLEFKVSFQVSAHLHTG
jgi:hypothetical protein